MQTLMLPFTPRFIVLTICAVVTRCCSTSASWIARRSTGADAAPDVRRADPARLPRSPAEEPRGAAQLSDLGASALPARRNPAGDAAVFLREREGRHAVLPRHPRDRLSARQDASSTSGRSAPRSTSIATATSGCTIRWRRSRRRTTNFRITIGGPDCTQALFGLGVQHLGDELRLAERQRDPRAQRAARRRAASPTTPARAASAPITARCGGDIIWEIGSGYFGCRNGDGRFDPDKFAASAGRRPDQDGRAQAQPGRQARPWRRAAGAQRSRAEISQDPRRRDGRGLHLAGAAHRRSRRRSR